MLWKKNCFDQKEMLKMSWYSMHVGFWVCWFQWHRFEAVHSDVSELWANMYALSWKVLIIGLLSEYFVTLLKRLHLTKITTKCSKCPHWFYLFSYGKVKDVSFWDKDQISPGWAKGRGKRGCGGEAQNEVIFAKFPLLNKIQTLSHKLWVRQTSNYHHCNWPAQKPKCRNFQVMLSKFFLVKNNFVYF